MGSRDYTRLVLDLSGDTPYQLRRVPAADGSPARVYVDLPGARTNRQQPACASRGPLARMQTIRTDHGLRLVLDVPNVSAARAFPLLDPFRLVVDVEAAALSRAPTPTAAASTTTAGAGDTRAGAPVPTPGHAARLTIVLDPGHGGKDPGARGVGGVQEKDIVLAVALRLRERLQAVPNVAVVLTRDRDEFLSLEERTARANAEPADLFVSIHANAGPHPTQSGIETYYLNNTNDRATLRLAALENGVASVTGRTHSREVSLLLSSLIQDYKVAESATFAATVQRELVATVATRWPTVVDLGVKQGPFYVLVGAGMPCILVEVSFVTHPEEGARLATPAYQDALCDGLLRGIQRFIDQHHATSAL